MTTTGRRVRRGRPPKGSETLTRAAILAAAIAVIGADGVQAVSMRTVARRLGVDAKSLYHHVDGKERLLDAVAEHVLAGVEIPAPAGSLEGDLTAIARGFRRDTLAHPQAATLVLTRQLSSFTGLAPLDAALSALRRAGVSAEESVHLVRALLALVVGTLLRKAQAGPTARLSDAAGVDRRRATLQESGFPSLVEAAPVLARCDHEQEFEHALALMVDAVAHRTRSTSDR